MRWEESIRRLRAEGVELFVEVGPGKVLSGLVRQIDRAAECLRVEDSATLSEVTARWRRRRALSGEFASGVTAGACASNQIFGNPIRWELVRIC